MNIVRINMLRKEHVEKRVRERLGLSYEEFISQISSSLQRRAGKSLKIYFAPLYGAKYPVGDGEINLTINGKNFYIAGEFSEVFPGMWELKVRTVLGEGMIPRELSEKKSIPIPVDKVILQG